MSLPTWFPRTQMTLMVIIFYCPVTLYGQMTSLPPVLPSQVHPSYPYGNPTNIKHPAAKPRRPYDPSSRALFEDMGYAGGGVNGSLRWKDLALDLLLPVDEEKEEAEKAAQARKMASGVTANHAPPPPPPAAPVDEDNEDEDNDNNDEDGSQETETSTSDDEDDE